MNVPVYAEVTGSDSDPTSWCAGHVSCEQIGTMQFQYALWKGYQGSPTYGGRVGAAVMGGFQLTDPADTNGQFSFLQMYQDPWNPKGVVDGGGYFGKFNYLIPRWTSNPHGYGWNYGANAYQYQFWDVPFDFAPGSPPENVTFETVLVNYTGASVTALADFTWSFDTTTGLLTGQQIAVQGGASQTLLTLYANSFPGVTYANGVLTPSSVPEPTIWATLTVGFGLTGAGLRYRRSRQATRA